MGDTHPKILRASERTLISAFLPVIFWVDVCDWGDLAVSAWRRFLNSSSRDMIGAFVHVVMGMYVHV